MKLLLLSLLIQHFSIQNNSVIWQQTYNTSLNQSQFISAVKNSGVLENIEIDGNTITGRVNNLQADFKGAGYSEMRTSFFIARNYYNAFAVITFSEGQYQVTLKNITLEYRYTDGLSQQGEKSNLESYLLNKKRTDFKSNITQDVTILDYTFTNRFKIG